MAGDAASVAGMRGGANRFIGPALLASILLHALVLAALPSLRSLVVEVARAPQPLVAHLAQPVAPAPAPVEEAQKPPPPAARPQARRSAPAPAPAALPAQPVVSEPSPPPPAVPLTLAAPGPLARIEPQPPPEEDAREGYVARVNDAAVRFKIYPRAAIDNNWEGEVVVLMRIGADGRIADLRVRKSSGYEVLDRQALQMFRNAKPFVPVPRALRGSEFEVELRAIYNLKDQGSG